ncbi:MAG: hypothetical protein ACYDCK_01395 [Thermoplasmatota archaeon]
MRSVPASSRPGFLRDTILRHIEGVPPTRFRHPDTPAVVDASVNASAPQAQTVAHHQNAGTAAPAPLHAVSVSENDVQPSEIPPPEAAPAT